MSIWPPGKRPSERIEAVLRGIVPLESEDSSIQSACSWYIYDGASEILRMSSKQARQAALAKIPKRIRPHIEAEIMRLHRMKR
jgi:hypothetical protein